MTTAVLDSIDLTDAELYRHGFPHELFCVLREEAPVWWHPDTPERTAANGGFWVVSRHADVQAVSRDHQRFRSFEGPALTEMPAEQHGLMIVGMDPPDHTRLRRLISAGFTPRMVAQLDSQARAWAVAIVERALERGTCNFVQEVAYQLPMQMIADIMGIPVADREWLFERVNVLLQSTDPKAPLTREQRAAVEVELYGYADELGAEKRRCPADDVWTTLTTAEIDSGNGDPTQLTELELDLFFFVLTAAGSETTRNAISAGLIALLENPDQLDLLRSDPAVMPTAVDEILRWTSPVSYFRRTTTADTDIRGVPIAAGERVTVWFPSANRDEDAFDDPFAFDIARSVNPHVTLGGGGVHYCLGANLAKREIRVMFEELLARVADIEIVGPAEYAVQGIGNPILMSLQIFQFGSRRAELTRKNVAVLDADASLRPRSVSVISETMGGETMVIDTESGVFYSLRGVASAMWLAVEAGVSAADLAAALRAQFPEAAAPDADVATLLDPLTQDGVVTASDIPSSGAPTIAWPDTYAPAVVERHGDMNDLLLVDPLHDVDDTGWPRRSS